LIGIVMYLPSSATDCRKVETLHQQVVDDQFLEENRLAAIE